LLCDVPHHDRRVLPSFRGLLRSGDGVAIGNGCHRGVCRNRPAGGAPALRPDRGIFTTRFMGPAARISAHGAYSAFEPGQLTAIPLAYGVLCAAIDFCLAAYFCARYSEWIAAWKAVPKSAKSRLWCT